MQQVEKERERVEKLRIQFNTTQPKKWSCEQVVLFWVPENGLGEYRAAFSGIDGKKLLKMSVADLMAKGLDTVTAKFAFDKISILPS